ncbi:hypothetical protein CDL15_Pgr017092 [Punica granatum]|uniref:Alkane hydroxylase MAH1-like n=1 Tax=Punica granatum TaxID=22663 RepID=A0A218VYM4_PUNGR|nr:hypothetical protein CDL15_Pgr017092 [Punica granatum]
MAMFGLFEIFLALVCFIILRRLGSNTSGLPMDWPLVGILPTLLSQVGRIHDWITELLLQANCNFLFRGPWFSNMDMLITADPANVHYIMSSNFVNFPKGSEFKRIFDVLGDRIFNVDYELGKDQRRVAVSLINHRKFQQFLERTSRDKIQNGLLPILDQATKKGLVLDLQDLFERFTFDSICKLVTGFDSRCLSDEFPEVPFAKALDDAEEAIFFRHIFPEFVWKLQRWVGIGQEKKLSQAWKSFDRIIAEHIKTKREELTEGGDLRSEEEGSDLLTSYMKMDEDGMSGLGCNED